MCTTNEALEHRTVAVGRYTVFCFGFGFAFAFVFVIFVQYATERKCMRAVKSVAVQVWFALILLLLSLLLLSLRVCCVCIVSLFHSFVRLHFASSFIYVYTYDWRCPCV